MRTVSTPYPRRRRSGVPHSGKRASLGSGFELLPPPPLTTGLRVCVACFCVEPVSLLGQPRQAHPVPALPETISGAPEPPLLPAIVAGQGTGLGPGQGRPGRLPRQGWRLPQQLQFPAPRPAPWGCRGPRHPSASPQPQNRAPLPQDRLPGRARVDGTGKAV